MLRLTYFYLGEIEMSTQTELVKQKLDLLSNAPYEFIEHKNFTKLKKTSQTNNTLGDIVLIEYKKHLILSAKDKTTRLIHLLSSTSGYLTLHLGYALQKTNPR